MEFKTVPYEIDDIIRKVYKYSSLGEYLDEESRILKNMVLKGSTLIDFGCGNGRYLRLLKDRLLFGLGIDNDPGHIKSARNLSLGISNLQFLLADAKTYTSESRYSIAISMYNTIGNINPASKVIEVMRSVCQHNGKLIVSVFSEPSIEERVEFYQKIGFGIKRVSEKSILTDKGVESFHYSRVQISRLIPGAEIIPCSRFGWLAIKSV
ncbi:class I SAM-dependent methyltransferase [Microbulbifer sp. THAF38]|uniref:class I SAM-dependent methyltransferase n=1 Tax=Microbulbifer sp. THAF38 TaxID=2587856 RepID=UPI0012680B33|nr:methyltransferase domain-containing protein [Microbulbifer sp. THAF38]QFT56820.1 Methionine biosynthesis protein MetW [Microbulbifer sp. THAF38]